jgi:5,10-methylenetetrahydromethanopterin reductase
VTPSARTGLAFAGAPRVPEIVRLARLAEEGGFESVWMAETRLTRDAFTAVAAMAAATERIKLGTGIVNVFTRGPVVLAISFLSLEELAPGRILMGLGTGSPLVLAPQGVAFERPLTRLREYVDVLGPLMRGERVDYEGESVRLDGARIEDVLSESDGDAATPRPPLYLGVTGRRALELAGEVADGVLMNVCLPTSYVESRLEVIERGAHRAGRQLGDLDVAMIILVSPDADSAAGKERARRFIALYLALFPNIARETGLDPLLIETTRASFHAKGIDEAARLVGDDVVDLLAAAGTPEECRARIEAYRRAGVQLPVLIAVEGALDTVVETLAPERSSTPRPATASPNHP